MPVENGDNEALPNTEDTNSEQTDKPQKTADQGCSSEKPNFPVDENWEDTHHDSEGNTSQIARLCHSRDESHDPDRSDRHPQQPVYTPIPRRHSFMRYARLVIQRNSIASNWRRHSERRSSLSEDTQLNANECKLVSDVLNDLALDEDKYNHLVFSRASVSQVDDSEAAACANASYQHNVPADIAIYITRPSTNTVTGFPISPLGRGQHSRNYPCLSMLPNIP